MPVTGLPPIWESVLALALLGSTLLTIFLLTLPSTYSFRGESPIRLSDFTEDHDDTSNVKLDETGRSSANGKSFYPSTSVVIFVLGDIGRSPRMQYHALSIARYGGRVDIVGYYDSDVLTEIQKHKLINVVPLKKLPSVLNTSSKALFPIVAPLKVLFQAWSVYYALGYSSLPKKYMLVQNPPSIPTLIIAQIICFIRGTKLIIDWHNLGHTILALKLRADHILVKASEAYERAIAPYAAGHLAVSQAMAKWLERHYGIKAEVLHDQPAKLFQPTNDSFRKVFLQRLSETKQYATDIVQGRRRLMVSSTSWTADEDFSILLDALVAYSATRKKRAELPALSVIITGKGPLKDYYLGRIATLVREGKIHDIEICTAWLTMEDYAQLLAAADLGVSLHMSSSGIDLPMKVVDMFGAGLPVVGYSDFEAWPELVQENVNGRGFKDAASMQQCLLDVFGDHGSQLAKLKQGAMLQSKRRWEHEWPKIASMFGIKLGNTA